MTSKDAKAQVDILLDKYQKLDGRARAQTARDALAISTVEVLLAHRQARASQGERRMAAIGVPDAPATWPVMRARRGWNGACRRCGKPARAGERLAWDPKSGRPSTWQHVSCMDPFGEGAKKGQKQPGFL